MNVSQDVSPPFCTLSDCCYTIRPATQWINGDLCLSTARQLELPSLFLFGCESILISRGNMFVSLSISLSVLKCKKMPSKAY